MKIRNGFVSNSSSSSFVCDVCGRSEEIYDDCSAHVLSIIPTKNGKVCRGELKSFLMGLGKWEDFIKWSSHEKDYSWFWEGIPEQFCPFEAMHFIKREDLMKFLLKKAGFPGIKEANELVKTLFPSYQDFKKYIEDIKL